MTPQSPQSTHSPRPAVPAWSVLAVAAVLCVPLVIAVVQLRTPTWRPVLDLAMTELRVRDVGTSDTPLIGLPGRIGETLEEQGSHPGPLSFYALAPTYRLLGASAWGMQVGTLVIHLAAMLVALALARRRGGALGMAAVAAVLAVLLLGYGAGAMVEPWNPYLPLMWWVVLLLAVWSVAAGDLVALPLAVLAGSFCAQTHVPYLTLSLGLGALAAVWVAVAARRLPGDDPRRRDTLRWGAVALGLGVVLWLPPTIDQVVNDPGNYAKLVDHFTTPPAAEDPPIGVRAAAGEALQRLDLWHLTAHQLREPALLTEGSAERFPSAWRGAALLVAWGGAVAATWARVRDRRLVGLHAVTAAAFVLGAVSISRIFGLTWYYLMLWMWAVAALMAVATAWTAWRWWAAGGRPPVRGQAVVLALGAVVVVFTGRATIAATSAEPSDAELSVVLHELVEPTIGALERGEGPATGRSGTYLVTWRDALHIGSQAYGLMSELDRAGFDVGLLPVFRVPATEHRTVEPGEATAVVELATGRFVDERREDPRALEVIRVDPRSPDDIERFEALRSRVLAELEAAELEDLVDAVDGNLFGAAVDPRVPDVTRRRMDEMLKIGLPTSVFVLPPELGP